MRNMKKLLLALALTLALAAPAGASAWNHITGTAYSNGAVYTSSIVRTKAGTDRIQAQFSSLPKNGLVFGVKAQTGQGLGSNTWTQIETDITRNVSAANVANGTKFVTYFRLQSKCTSIFGCTPYNFDGSLRY